MLTDAQVERYARQIVLPQVGGQGQARLLASHVVLVGDGDACRRVGDLLARAGVRLCDATTDGLATLLFDLRLDGTGPTPAWDGPVVRARLEGAQALLTLLPAFPCCACPPDDAPRATRTDAPGTCAAHALAALAATEGLLALLDPSRPPRRYVVDTFTGTFRSEPLSRARCSHGGYRP
jgi:hypothetical protein